MGCVSYLQVAFYLLGMAEDADHLCSLPLDLEAIEVMPVPDYVGHRD